MNAVAKLFPLTASADRSGHRQIGARELVIAVAAAIVVSVIVGACGSDSESSEMPDGVEQVVEDYTSAFVAQDGDAWQATITDDYFNRRYIYGAGSHELWDDWVLEEDDAKGYLHRIEFFGAVEYEEIGAPVVSGDGPWFVSLGQQWIAPDAGVTFDGNATYAVVERDGELKIASETFTGTAGLVEE